MDSKEMKICIISSWLPSNKRPNFSPFVYNFAVNLTKYGINVSVIGPQDNGDKPVMHEDSMTTYRVNRRLPLFPIYRLIDKIEPDIIHVHAPNLFSCNAIPVAKFKKIPILATVHRAEIDLLRNPIFFLRKYALARFERVISVSNYSKSLAIRAGVDGNKICVIHNSCNESFFLKKDKFAIRSKYKLPSEKIILLFVGNLIRLKGLYTLIESFKILCNSNAGLLLLIIGQGDERKRIESLVSSYHLGSNIKFLGWLPQENLSDLYNAADIFVLPSMTEGHSVALLEAMAVGLPIVASRIGGNLETIEDGINGYLFESGSVEKLAEKLDVIVSNMNLRRMMSEQSSKIYIEKFSTKSHMNNYLKIYYSILDKK